MRDFFHRKPVGHHAGHLFQIYEKTVRRRPAHFSDVAAAPPFPEERLLRIENRRAFLDRAVAAGRHHVGNA